MKVTGYQVSLVHLVLRVNKENTQRQFPIEELGTASAIMKVIKPGINVTKEGNVDGTYKDIEVDFTSEEKVFLSKMLKERSWAVVDAEPLFELQELLK